MAERFHRPLPDRTKTFRVRRFHDAGRSVDEDKSFHNFEVGTRWGVVGLQIPADTLREESLSDTPHVDAEVLQEALTYIANQSRPRHSLIEETLHTYTIEFIAANWDWISSLLAVVPDLHIDPRVFPEVQLGEFGTADLIGSGPDGSLHVIEVGSFYANKDEQLERYGRGAHHKIPGVNGNLVLTVGRYLQLPHGRLDPRMRVRLESLPVSTELPANVDQPQRSNQGRSFVR